MIAKIKEQPILLDYKNNTTSEELYDFIFPNYIVNPSYSLSVNSANKLTIYRNILNSMVPESISVLNSCCNEEMKLSLILGLVSVQPAMDVMEELGVKIDVPKIDNQQAEGIKRAIEDINCKIEENYSFINQSINQSINISFH